MHPDLEPFIEHLGVSVSYDHPIEEPARLFCLGDTAVIACRRGLSGPDLWGAIGIQLGYVAMGFNCKRPMDPRLAIIEHELATRWAAEVMIPESHKTMALRDRWTPRHLARLCFVPEELAHLRLRNWMMKPKRLPPPPGRPGSP